MAPLHSVIMCNLVDMITKINIFYLVTGIFNLCPLFPNSVNRHSKSVKKTEIRTEKIGRVWKIIHEFIIRLIKWSMKEYLSPNSP